MDPMFQSFLAQIAKPFDPNDLPSDEQVKDWHENGTVATPQAFERFLSEYGPTDWHAVIGRLALEEASWSALIGAILRHPDCDLSTVYSYYLASAPISYLLEGQPHPSAADLAPHFESAIRPKAPNLPLALGRLRRVDQPARRFDVAGHLSEMYDARGAAMTKLFQAFGLSIPEQTNRTVSEIVRAAWIVDRSGIRIPIESFTSG